MDALEKLVQLEKEADAFGFSWENSDQIFDQLFSEVDEIKEHLGANEIKNKMGLQEEIGDLFHAVTSLCLFFQFNPEDTIKKSVEKFKFRLEKLKKVTRESGLENLKE